MDINKDLLEAVKKAQEFAKATAPVDSNPNVREALEKVLEAFDEVSATRAKYKADENETAEKKAVSENLLTELKAYSIRCWVDAIPAESASAALRFRLAERNAPKGTRTSYGYLVGGAVRGLRNGTITPEVLQGFKQKQWQDAVASAESKAMKAALDAITEAFKAQAESEKWTAATMLEHASLIAESVKSGSYIDAALASYVDSDDAGVLDGDEKQAA